MNKSHSTTTGTTSKKHSLPTRSSSSSSKLKKRRDIPRNLGPEASDIISLTASATNAAESATTGKSAKENESSLDGDDQQGDEGDFIKRRRRLDGRHSAREGGNRERCHATLEKNDVQTRNTACVAHRANTTFLADEKFHFLSSIDTMDPPLDSTRFSNILSSFSATSNRDIESILGKYKSSFSEFQMNLEMAFSPQFTRRDSVVVGSSKIHDLATMQHKEVLILHPLLGRIGANPWPGDAITELSFPRSNGRNDYSTIPVHGGNVRNNFFIQQKFGQKRRRKSADGMSIPLSVFQFPNKSSKPSEDNDQMHGRSPSDQQQIRQHDGSHKQSTAMFGDENMPPTDEPLPPADNAAEALEPYTAISRDDLSKIDGITTDKRKRLFVSASPTSAIAVTSTSPATTNLKYQVMGKIQITSDRGATIREAFDIDESKCILGKIFLGDVRSFVEKKTLPPPPPPSPRAKDTRIDENNGSSGSEEGDEECIAVTRYKILLHDGDCSNESSRLVERDESGNGFGWISDRARLADDPYLILKEV
ncbi:hypothetical protein ACHAXS_013361 [Conticribra weissflogii]